MAITTLNTPAGWTKITTPTQDMVDAEYVTEWAPVAGTSSYVQAMKQSNELSEETPRWYLLAALLHGDKSLSDYHYFYKDSASQPAFPVAFVYGGGSSSGGSTTPPSTTVQDIQRALNNKWKTHANYPLVVDGKFGPKTCSAALGYQKSVVGVAGTKLTTKFFTMLGLPSSMATTYGSSCVPSGGGGGEDEPEPVPPPIPVPSTFPWKETLIGAAGGTLVGLAGKKTVLKKAKIKSWQAGVAGALVGALGGFIAGKMRA